MQPIYYLLFIAAVVGADQLTKYLVVSSIVLGGEVSFLPGFLCFTYWAVLQKSLIYPKRQKADGFCLDILYALPLLPALSF